jgi:hydrogenase small subunit
MFFNGVAWKDGEGLAAHLERRGVSRREFMTFCAEMTAILGLSTALTPRIVEALERARRPSVIWLQLQECTGCVESVLRTSDPTIGDLLLDVISLDFQETLMAGAGASVEDAKEAAMKENFGKYILLVTGSVPTKDDGIYCTIAGKTAREHLEHAAEGAAAIVAIGACAHFGSVQSARPNPTGALVHFLTFGKLPDLDGDNRPLFAYGSRIHDQCPRRAKFDAGQFVEMFDDEAARKGYCLYHVGCKGPATFSPCPIFMWNGHTSFPIGAGHPCIGCTERNFWDTMSPFYTRLPDVYGVGVEKTADTLGAALAIGAVAGVAAHAAATGIHQIQSRRREAAASGGKSNG